MKTDVVLLPGMHGTTALFDSFVALPPSWANCLPVDLPSTSGQSFEELAAAIGSRVHGLEQMVVVGESFSGPVAAQLYRQLGPKVVLLVLCNPLVRVGVPVYPALAGRLAISRWVPPVAVAWLMTGGNRSLARAVLRETRRAGAKLMSARIATALGATASWLTADLSDILVVVATRDRLLASSITIDAFHQIPSAAVVPIEAPHLIVQTHPSEVWQAIAEEFQTAA